MGAKATDITGNKMSGHSIEIIRFLSNVSLHSIVMKSSLMMFIASSVRLVPGYLMSLMRPRFER